MSMAWSIALVVTMMGATYTLYSDGVVWLGRRGVVDSVVDCWNGVMFAAAGQRNGPVTFSLGLSCLRERVVLAFISLSTIPRPGIMVS